MIEIKNPKIDIEQIKECIANEMAQYETMEKSVHNLEETKSLDQFVTVPQESASLVDMSLLLCFHGDKFIHEAYHTILGRVPDAQGSRQYLEKLMTGRLTRVDILGRLRYSREGRLSRVRVPGLLSSFLIHSFFKIPVLGWAARVITGVLNFPGLMRYIQRIENEFFARHCELEQQLDVARSSIRDFKNDLAKMKNQIEESHSALAGQIAEQNKKTEEQKLMNLDSQRSLRILLEKSRKGLSDKSLPQPLVDQDDDHLLDGLYLAFENSFRGPTEEIKRRLSVYLPHVTQTLEHISCRQVLDLGCGRGEWLELLKENQIPAIGVDLNHMMADICKKSGLNVVVADVIAYLQGQAPESVGVLTGFHIVEHLSFHTLVALLDESYRALTSGGMVIFETPNPENIQVGACDFYTDPTHKNPIPPLTLSYLVEARGFSNIKILRLNPAEKVEIKDSFLNHLFTVGRDYAVIGYKS